MNAMQSPAQMQRPLDRGAQKSAPQRSREGCLRVRLRLGMVATQARCTSCKSCCARSLPSIVQHLWPLGDRRNASHAEAGRTDEKVRWLEARFDMDSLELVFNVGSSGGRWKCLPLPPPCAAGGGGGRWGQTPELAAPAARPAAPQGLLRGAIGASGSGPSSRRQTSQ